MQIGIVRARFNEAYTQEMVAAAKEQADSHGADVNAVVEVPGSHEVPVAVDTLLAREDIDGVAAVGVIIKGATDHDQVLGYNVSKQLLELSCQYGKPVGLGIIGPGVSWSQAEKRTIEYAERAVDAVIETHEALQDVRP